MNLSRSNRAQVGATALVTIIVWALKQFAHVDVPADVGLAAATGLVVLVGGSVSDQPG